MLRVDEPLGDGVTPALTPDAADASSTSGLDSPRSASWKTLALSVRYLGVITGANVDIGVLSGALFVRDADLWGVVGTEVGAENQRLGGFHEAGDLARKAIERGVIS